MGISVDWEYFKMKVIYFLTLFFVGNSYACWLGNGKGLCRSGDERACLGSLGNGKGLFRKDKNREATDDGLSSLTLQAFEKCDTDDLFGLSWDEIERCEEEFCAILSIPCPTEEEFDSFDENEDGNLTLEEYIIHVQKLIDESE